MFTRSCLWTRCAVMFHLIFHIFYKNLLFDALLFVVLLHEFYCLLFFFSSIFFYCSSLLLVFIVPCFDVFAVFLFFYFDLFVVFVAVLLLIIVFYKFELFGCLLYFFYFYFFFFALYIVLFYFLFPYSFRSRNFKLDRNEGRFREPILKIISARENNQFPPVSSLLRQTSPPGDSFVSAVRTITKLSSKAHQQQCWCVRRQIERILQSKHEIELLKAIIFFLTPKKL